MAPVNKPYITPAHRRGSINTSSISLPFMGPQAPGPKLRPQALSFPSTQKLSESPALETSLSSLAQLILVI